MTKAERVRARRVRAIKRMKHRHKQMCDLALLTQDAIEKHGNRQAKESLQSLRRKIQRMKTDINNAERKL